MALTQINNACLFPCAALFIFSPYTEPSICKGKTLYHLQEYYHLMTQGGNHINIIPIIPFIYVYMYINKFRLSRNVLYYLITQIQAFREGEHEAYKIPYLLDYSIFFHLPIDLRIQFSVHRQEEHVIAQRDLCCSEKGRNMSPLPNLSLQACEGNSCKLQLGEARSNNINCTQKGIGS